MFRENQKYQVSLFGIVYQLPVGVKKMLDQSWAPAFRKLIFDKIDEKRYAVLYSDLASRPNFPVNVWVGLEILKGQFDYTDEELMRQFHFDLLTAYALGQEGLGELTLCIRTVYYNRERLLEYEAKTGRNLLAEEFNSITDDALKQLGVDTGTQRMDSSFVGSFIKKMSRLEIAVKVLQNFHKELPEEDQKRWQPLLADYLEEEAQHLSFRLKRSEVEAHLIKVGEWLFKLHEAYAQDEKITGLRSYAHVGRVLQEQFQVTKEKEQTAIEVKPAKEISPASRQNPADDEATSGLNSYPPTGQVLSEQFQVVNEEEKTSIEVKPAKEISASSLQNPADDTATFRRKGGEEHQGYVFNVAETCSPANPVQLLTDIALYPNTTYDEAIAAERVPHLKERTNVGEMITDANFTGEASEKVCAKEGVVLIPTEMKGRKLSEDELSLKDFQLAEARVIACPTGLSPAREIHNEEKGRCVIRFSRELCGGCPMVAKCPVVERQKFYSFSFSDRQAVVAQRRQELDQENYREKCRLRPAVEGTVSQFKQRTHNGKLRVRGYRRARNVVILMAIAINFRRIWDYLVAKDSHQAPFPIVAALLFAFVAAIFAARRLRRSLTGQTPISQPVC